MDQCQLSLEVLLSSCQNDPLAICPLCDKPVGTHNTSLSQSVTHMSALSVPVKVQSTITCYTATDKQTNKRLHDSSTIIASHKKPMKQPNLEYSFGYLRGVSFIGKDSQSRTKPSENISPLLKKQQAHVVFVVL